MSRVLRTLGRAILAPTLVLGVVGALTLGPPAYADPALPEVGDLVVAPDDTSVTVGAIDPPSRLAGLVAIYTPGFGATTGTNQWGAEAILEATGDVGRYRVVDVCTALAACTGTITSPGNNAIPANGYVLSISPGAVPDLRAFIADHLNAGDEIVIRDQVSRTSETTIDVVDPTPATNPAGIDPGSGRCYPGCRGAEQMIAYTPASGRATTETNDYGYEVTVVGDTIVGVGGGNRAIPPDGLVLSGHGSRGTWLQANAVLGAIVDIDGATLRITVDERTAIFSASSAITAAQARIDSARSSCLAFPETSAEDALTQARTTLAAAEAARATDPALALSLARRAEDSALTAGYRAAESRPAEGRAIWVRPIETTPDAIAATVRRVTEAGFTSIFLETVWQGYTIYPSAVARSYGIADQRPNMVGFDPLQVWIDEAHAAGIEIHPWVHTFFVGSDQENHGPGPVLTAHPDWAAVEREDVGADGPRPSSQEPGYYFVDPANAEARGYVEAVFREILTDYDVDGLHLDYIRYPVSQPWETAGYSYSDGSRSMFQAEYGVDPYTLTPADSLWQSWNEWREHQVTTFVEDVRAMQQDVAPDVPLSAAVFPDPSDGLAKKFQNWGAWVDAGLVDVLTGMSFGTSMESVAHDTATMRTRVGDDQLLYTATYGPFRGSDPAVLINQVDAVRGADSDGAALFAYNQLTDAQAAALREGVFRTDAAIPHRDLAAASTTGLADMRAHLDAASGACLSTTGASGFGQTLDEALALIAAGDTATAVDRLDTAATQLAAATLSGDGPELYAARGERDLRMYIRWLNRVPSQSPSTPTPQPTAEPSTTDPGAAPAPSGATTGATGALPNTGVSPVPITVVGLIALGLGAVVVVAYRRRRSRS